MDRPAARQPLGEVFGFPAQDVRPETHTQRWLKLCPYNNRVDECTKDRTSDPLGVCSVHHRGQAVVTCPVRFREGWTIAADAARFFFADVTKWDVLSEVQLYDQAGGQAGNIDMVVVAHDEEGQILDFGAVEVQAVYISGNVRAAFEDYMRDPVAYLSAPIWQGTSQPRPDFLSSSRKRLLPQLLYKGSLLHAWGKRQAVVLQRAFYETLPPLPRVEQQDADMAWLLYDLAPTSAHAYTLTHVDTVYTRYADALARIQTPPPTDPSRFEATLQTALFRKRQASRRD